MKNTRQTLANCATPIAVLIVFGVLLAGSILALRRDQMRDRADAVRAEAIRAEQSKLMEAAAKKHGIAVE